MEQRNTNYPCFGSNFPTVRSPEQVGVDWLKSDSCYDTGASSPSGRTSNPPVASSVVISGIPVLLQAFSDRLLVISGPNHGDCSLRSDAGRP